MTEKSSKLYYTISEVAAATGVKPHVLRYWEGEFPTLSPRKTRSGSRRYRQPDIDEILAIKKLLYDEGFRIAGARKVRRQVRSGKAPEQTVPPPQMAIPFAELEPRAQLVEVRKEIGEVLALIRELRSDLPAIDEPSGALKEAEAES